MLVLTRGIDEGLVINDNIRITVVRVRDGVVRIGIDAPDDAVILRGELVDKHSQELLLRQRDEPPK
jgi:carbon storage regulator